MAPTIIRQTWALVRKNLIINVRRNFPSTLVRAFLLPIIFISFLSFARFLFVPPAKYGVGSPAPVKELSDALAAHSSRQLVFVNNGVGNDVNELIRSMQDQLKGKGIVKNLDREDDLQTECKQSIRGVSPCFAAISFQKSPRLENSVSPKWNYTIRSDFALNDRLNVNKHSNGVQEYLLPLQLAVDRAIARQEGYSGPEIQVSEYMFTDKTDQEYQDSLITRFASTVVNYLAVALLVGMVGVVYHLAGFQATEREKGLSKLIEAMGGSNIKFARMASYHIAFSLIYFSGWLVTALSLWGGFFKSSSIIMIIVWHILAGWALTSWSIFLGSIFKKAQLSGITAAVLTLGLGIIAQVSKGTGTVQLTILSALFPPMNYVFFAIYLARFEQEKLGASMIKGPPTGNSTLPLLVLLIFSLVHVIVFPLLAAYVERYLYGTESRGNRITDPGAVGEGNAVEIRGFTKRYPPRLLSRLFGKNKETVLAVNSLNLNILEGQILVLLGANGSGKTTTLEAVAGLSSIDEGEIRISTGQTGTGIGICPQKNVLWDDLTVLEHIKIWNLIKSTGDDLPTLKKLIDDCDLAHKKHAKSKTLSGGQKRKLQLAAMFTGGSSVCAIDEVSSGLDPMSRRKIWDIILAARGYRTILMTSHFLDEADLLSDHIAVLSNGNLKCDGSAVQLKTQYGGGYRVHAPINAPEFQDISMKRFYDKTIYNVRGPHEANQLILALEKAGVSDYYVNGPTIEDVFLKVAEESVLTMSENKGEKSGNSEQIDKISSSTSQLKQNTVDLHNGRHISVLRQTWIMICKRITILQRGYLPLIAAVIIPIIAAAVTMVTLKDFEGVSCAPKDQLSVLDVERFDINVDNNVVVGPKDKADAALKNLIPLLLASPVVTDIGSGGSSKDSTDFLSLDYVNSLDSFENYIINNQKTVFPGGFFLGSNNATFAFWTNGFSPISALVLQNAVDNALLNVRGGIAVQYLPFDYPWASSQGVSLLFVLYAGLAFVAYPAFFSLYPTIERIRKVRALHYSNGVRVLPLWLGYLIFDFAAILTISALSAIILETAVSGWYGGVGYIFIIMVLYGIASALFVYCITLFVSSQLAAFAFAAGGQAALFLIYFMTYMTIITYSKPEDLQSTVDLARYIIAAFAPIVSLMHTFFVALNSFSIDCEDKELAPNPAAFRLYGGPILYLILQSIALFTVLILHDLGKLRINMSFRKHKPTRNDEEDVVFDEKEIAEEVRRVESSNDGLRVRHVSKQFSNFQAVDDITFGAPQGEVFALLGPNGAGKTTIINMVRGEIPPTSGEIFVQKALVSKNRSAARAHLGVCPQFDAMDRMTVVEHLVFYAKIRGVPNIEHNVNEVLRAVGLDEFKFRVAEKLSGGNKRKLSLAIALMGNPSVLLLDEPSSGMDAASKRVMWRTLETVVPGRSIVLTTHSMEECSALATRAGIMSKRMLALDTTERLRQKYGNKYLVHVVLSSAPHSSEAEMKVVTQWIAASFPGAELEPRSFGGQIRFSIPARLQDGDGETNTVGRVFSKLETQGVEHGLEFWSVDRGTMDMVFLDVVERAKVKEEGDEKVLKKKWKMILMWVFVPWMHFIK